MPDSATYAEREGAVVYLDERLVEARAAVVVDGRDVVVKRPTAVAFVDREPGVSWGHRCRYLLVDVEIGDVLCSVAQMPPFLHRQSLLRVIHRGPSVPDWAVCS